MLVSDESSAYYKKTWRGERVGEVEVSDHNSEPRYHRVHLGVHPRISATSQPWLQRVVVATTSCRLLTPALSLPPVTKLFPRGLKERVLVLSATDSPPVPWVTKGRPGETRGGPGVRWRVMDRKGRLSSPHHQTDRAILVSRTGNSS